MRSRWSLSAGLAMSLVLLSSRAGASPPDPARSTVPRWILVGGKVNGGIDPDPVGLATVVVRSASNNPMVGVAVKVDFSGCCDIELCDAGVGHNCAARTVSGLTNSAGEFSFIVLGAARDPGTLVPPAQFGGCGQNGVVVFANNGSGDIALGIATAVTLDLNGAAGQSNGTSGSDVSNLINLLGSISLEASYLGRGDVNCDGQISGGDVAALISHFGRLSLVGGVGCTGAFCANAACP